MSTCEGEQVDEREIDLMVRWQGLAGRGVPAARALSAWGEHAGGWLVLGSVGALVDHRRRGVWAAVAGAAFAAHAAAVVTKRVVRRPRPSSARVRVLTATPSDLSFPSAHAASTTAACVALVPVVGAGPAAAVALAMGGARVLLGVHYPSDVAVGMVLGAASGATAVRGARRLPR